MARWAVALLALLCALWSPRARAVGGFGPLLPARAFTPLSLGPTAWYRSDLGITTVSGAVSQWLDQSGNGLTLTQSTSGNRPTYNTAGGANGRPRLTWGASSIQYLASGSLALSMSPVEIMFVATMTSGTPSGNEWGLDLGAGNDGILQVSGTATVKFFNGTGVISLASATATVPFVTDCYNDGASSGFVALNGGTMTTGTVGTSTRSSVPIIVGSYGGAVDSGFNWYGDIYEVIVFAYHLSTSQRNQLLNYVSALYGITI